MVPYVNCTTAEEVHANNALIRARRKTLFGPYPQMPQVPPDYLPRIPWSLLVASAYPHNENKPTGPAPIRRDPKSKRELTMNEVKNGQRKIGKIIESVMLQTGIDKPAMLGDSRIWPLVRARHIAMALSHHLTSMSLPAIGREFNRDHTTVLHAVRRMGPIVSEVTKRLTMDNWLAEWVVEIRNSYDQTWTGKRNGEKRKKAQDREAGSQWTHPA